MAERTGPEYDYSFLEGNKPKKSNHTNQKRFHNLRYIEKVADLPGGRYNGTSRSGVSTNGESATGYNVADVYRFVKQYDKDFPAGRSVDPEMLNSDGTPKIVYHGTNAEFSAFDKAKIGSNTGNRGMIGEGFYFTENKDLARDYNRKNGDVARDGSGKVMEVYLTMTNPFVWSSIATKKQFGRFIKRYGLEDSGVRWNPTEKEIRVMSGDTEIQAFTGSPRSSPPRTSCGGKTTRCASARNTGAARRSARRRRRRGQPRPGCVVRVVD